MSRKPRRRSGEVPGKPKIGKEWKLWYPAHNVVGVPIEFVHYRLLVTDITDCSQERMAAKEWMRQPLQRFGSTLISGWEVELHQSLTFWLEATSEFDPPCLRLGVYCPDDDWMEIVSRDYGPTYFDRTSMRDEVRRFQEWKAAHPDETVELGVYRAEKVTA